MSWIYGFHHKHRADKHDLHNLTAQHEFHADGWDVYAGGREDVCYWQLLPDNAWLCVLGKPVRLQDGEYGYINALQWLELLRQPEQIKLLDGHFVVLCFDGTKLFCYNDALGKRSLYFVETPDYTYFCSDLTLLKSQHKTEIDYYKFGALWHAMYPPTQGGYAPLQGSYYRDVQMLGTGATAVLDGKTHMLNLESSPWLPTNTPNDPVKLLESYCLLPVKAGKHIGIGLSGGMDIRPLLAIYLGAGLKPVVFNYGSTNNYDYKVAKDIARHFGLTFRYIPYSETTGSWDQVLDFTKDRGVVFNPLHSANLGYYPVVAQECDTYISGYWGEVFRFRMMAANLKSLLRIPKLGYHDIGAYLYRNPPSFFVAEVKRKLHEGFWTHLKEAAGEMPSSRDMLNPMWMHLFVLRYWFHTLQTVNYPSIDSHVTNILPWIQPTLLSEHWRIGFFKQLNEGLHRSIIRAKCPALERFPLSATDVVAPYRTRQLALKLKSRAHYRKHPRLRDTRTTDFLNRHKERIMDLVSSQVVTLDEAIDQVKLKDIVKEFYTGDAKQQDAMVCFLAYALGK